MDREVSCLVTAPSPDAHHGPIRGNPDVPGREGRIVEDYLMRADVWLVKTSQATTGFRFDHYRAKGTSGGEGRPMV